MTKNMFPITFAAVLIYPAFLTAQPARSADVEFKVAQNKEHVEGDLKAAIEGYRKIAQGQDRAIAAKALVRLGICYEKLGDAEAGAAYERVVNSFSDQQQSVAEARTRLASLKGSAAPAGVVIRQVWSGPDACAWGTVSADGRYFSCTKNGDVRVHDFVTGGDRFLTTHEGQPRGAADFATISPDAKQVAYVWHNGKGWELRLIGANGNPPATPRVLYYNDDIRYPGPWAWTADSKTIAVQLQRKDKTVQIGLLSTADGSVRVLKTVGWGGAGDMAFSPDGRYLAFANAAERDARYKDVLIVATDGSREVLGASSAGSTNDPAAWTPDGKYLLFTSDRTEAKGLWAQRIEDGRPQGVPTLVKSGVGHGEVLGMTRTGTFYFSSEFAGTEILTATLDPATGQVSAPVSEFIGEIGVPRWSRDGKQLAYLHKRASPRSFSQIRIRSTESGQVREVRPKLRYMSSISWSPDGEFLTTQASDLKGRDGIFRVNAQTGESDPIVLTEFSPAGEVRSAETPRWMHDGKSIVYVRWTRKAGESHFTEAAIIQRDLGSGHERELIASGKLTAGALSPDGRQLAYSVRDNTAKRLSIMLQSMAGSERRELIGFEEGMVLTDWTPDSRELIIHRYQGNNPAFWVVSVADGSQRKLNIENAGAIRGFALHPNGRQIAYTVPGTTTKEVFALENFLPALTASR